MEAAERKVEPRDAGVPPALPPAAGTMVRTLTKAIRDILQSADVFVATAAVADWRPASASEAAASATARA